MKTALSHDEYEVLRLGYGLDCDKHKEKNIAKLIGVNGTSAHVKISQIKKQAIDSLSKKIKLSQVVDFL